MAQDQTDMKKLDEDVGNCFHRLKKLEDRVDNQREEAKTAAKLLAMTARDVQETKSHHQLVCFITCVTSFLDFPFLSSFSLYFPGLSFAFIYFGVLSLPFIFGPFSPGTRCARDLYFALHAPSRLGCNAHRPSTSRYFPLLPFTFLNISFYFPLLSSTCL